MVCESIISEGMNGSAKRGNRMKVRLEIIDEDGIESTNVEFGGKHWKRCLLAFIDSIEDENPKHTEPSSAYSQSSSQSSFNYNTAPGTAQGPVHSPAPQSAMQQQFPQQQQAMQQAFYQQQVPQGQYPQQAQYQQQSQYYLPPTVAPYYYYGQPAQSISSINPQQPPQYPPVQPAAPEVMPVRQQEAHVNALRQRAPGRTVSLQERMNDSSLTINERLELFLKYEYPRVWFSSQDVQQHYEHIYGTIKQSTVSTYLSRMYQKNLLERRGNRTQREYKYVGDEAAGPRQSAQAPAGVPQFHRNSVEYG
ncbi:MAG: hypothetical protein PWP63_2252 [Methanolobus sp.]|nr:hypothetical protein [Methanolobus sp.]